MPLVRCSQEVSNYLKRKSGETGEPMSILLDQWMSREIKGETELKKLQADFSELKGLVQVNDKALVDMIGAWNKHVE